MSPATRMLKLLPLLLFVACGSPPSPHVVPASTPREPRARFQLDEPAHGLTVAISVLDSPVELLAQAHFSIRTSDLASCRPATVEK